MNLFLTAILVLAALGSFQDFGITSAGDDEAKEGTRPTTPDPCWQQVFYDSCTEDWGRNWFLDGRKARITNSPDGMDFFADSTWSGHASHAVLWTKQVFEGDLKIEYEYTRLDSSRAVAVTILYIQATGSGTPPFESDILRWADLRSVPAMKMYFDHMHTYAISYAAFQKAQDHPDHDYIRARRYVPEGNGLEGTALEPDYVRTGLFKTGVPYQITVTKKGETLTMDIRGPDKTLHCRWQNHTLPPITEGRIGLRHMATRGARYRNFRISTLCSESQ